MRSAGDWRRLWVVYVKELTDHARDFRALFSASFGVFAGPIFVGLMLSAVADDRRELEEIRIPVAGAEHAPELIEWIESQAGVTIEEAPEDPEAAVRAGELEMALLVEEDFGERFAQARPAGIKVIFDGSDRSAEGRAWRARRIVEGYSRAISGLRLIARGVSPAVSEPIQVRNVEVSTAQRAAARVLGFLPMMILLAAFAAGMGAATDATAGERERGSLEALLVNPAPTAVIVGGKWLAAATLAAAGACLSLGLCMEVVSRIPLQELGLRFRIEPWQIGWAVAVVLPAAIFAPALQMLVCSFSRTLKEAQSYIGLLVMLPMAPAMVIMIFDIQREASWTNLIPFYGQTKLMGDVFGGELPALIDAALAAFGALGGTAICLAAMVRLWANERVVFGR